MAIKIILFIIFIVAIFGLVGWGVVALEDDQPMICKVISWVGVALFSALTFFIPGSIHQVKTGEVAVVRKFGVIKESKTPGIYYQNWITHKYEYYDTKVQQLEVETQAYSSDGQTLTLQLAIQYQIQSENVVQIATVYGDLSKLESRLTTISIERVKSVVSEKTAMNIIATRNVVSSDTTSRISEAITDEYYVNINSVVLTNIDFTDEFEKIVEDKVAAEQEAQKAINEAAKKRTDAEAAKEVAQLQADAELYKAQKESEALRVKAQAEADALKLEKKATSDAIQAYVDELGLTAEDAVKLYEYLIWVQKWDGDVPTVTDGAAGYIVVPQP